MILYTTHTRSGQTPVLVPEGFSWRAAIFGALYLLAHRAWTAAFLNVAALLLIALLGRLIHTDAPLWGLFILQGLLVPDLLRWNFSTRGYATGPVVAAPDPESALLRLLDARPDLLPAA